MIRHEWCLTRKPLGGFTLIEMMLVVSLLSMIGLGIFQVASNGLKIWSRAEHAVLEEDAAIMLDRLGRDLRNTRPYSLLSFDGKSQELSFPTIVRVRADPKGVDQDQEFIDQLGRIQIRFDAMKKVITMRQANYSQALESKWQKERVLLSAVSSLKFSYLYLNEQGLQKERETAGEVPYAVVMELEFPDAVGRLKRMVRSVDIPLAL